LHRLEDLDVPRAAAEVPRERLADLLARRVGVAVEKILRRAQDAGRAIAALRRSQLGERVLERVHLRAARQPLDRDDRTPLALDRKRQAGEDRTPLHEDRAGAALPELAAVLRPREPEILA